MLYTTEEAAVICGFLNAHLAQAGVEVSVRKRNAAFQRGVIMGTLQPDDYRWAENVLCFLKPCWWQLHEDHRALENVLLKTHLLAQESKQRAAPVLVGSILLSFLRCQLCKRLLQLEKSGAIAFVNRCWSVLLHLLG